MPPSPRNARKHSFNATTFPVVRLEEVDEVARLREDLIAVYQPVNSQELFAIERIALAQQNLLRAERLHSGLFTTCLNETISADGRPLIGISPHLVDEDNQIVKAQNRNFLLAEGFRRQLHASSDWTLFLRYQAQAERLCRRAIEDFERLKRLRKELPNQPILETAEPQPEAAPTPPKPARPPEHYGPDGELRFPYNRPAPDPPTIPSGDTREAGHSNSSCDPKMLGQLPLSSPGASPPLSAASALSALNLFSSSAPSRLRVKNTSTSAPTPPRAGATLAPPNRGCTIVESRGNCPESDVLTPDKG